MREGYRYAELTPGAVDALRQLEGQLLRETGKHVVLLAYEPDVKPTVVFNDIQQPAAGAQVKRNVFLTGGGLYGGIGQWHM